MNNNDFHTDCVKASPTTVAIAQNSVWVQTYTSKLFISQTKAPEVWSRSKVLIY